MNIKPLGNQILIKPKPPESKIGSFFIPQTAQKKITQGTVVGVGEGTYDKEGKLHSIEDVKVGDEVLYMPHDNIRETKVDGEDMIVLLHQYVLAVLEPK